MTSGTPTFSTKITSAPNSASQELTHGPATALETSTTFMPANGPWVASSVAVTASDSRIRVLADEICCRFVPPFGVMSIDSVRSRQFNYLNLRDELHSR